MEESADLNNKKGSYDNLFSGGHVNFAQGKREPYPRRGKEHKGQRAQRREKKRERRPIAKKYIQYSPASQKGEGGVRGPKKGASLDEKESNPENKKEVVQTFLPPLLLKKRHWTKGINKKGGKNVRKDQPPP